MNTSKVKSKKSKSASSQDAELAAKYAASTRTIARWRAEGAPLDEDKKMRAWLSGRKNLPPGTLAKLTSERRKERAAANAKIAAGPPLSEGASAALKRLEAAEARAHMASVEAEATADPVEMRLAETRWLRIAASLLRYDLAVEQSRRDAGELVPKAEMARIVSGFVSFTRFGLHGTLEGLCPRLTGITEPRDVWAILKTAEVDLRGNVLAALETWTWAEEPLPDWLHNLATEAFKVVPDSTEGAKWRRECFQEFCKQFAEFRAAHEAKQKAERVAA